MGKYTIANDLRIHLINKKPLMELLEKKLKKCGELNAEAIIQVAELKASERLRHEITKEFQKAIQEGMEFHLKDLESDENINEDPDAEHHRFQKEHSSGKRAMSKNLDGTPRY